MASVSTNKTTGERTLQFVLGGNRKSFWLGKMAKRLADVWLTHVEALVTAKIQGCSPPKTTSDWVESLDISVHRKLVKVGLVENRLEEIESDQRLELEERQLANFLDSYIAGRTDAKPATIVVYGHTRRCLIEFFGPLKPLGDIVPDNTDDFARWLRLPIKRGGQGLSENTARRRCGIAKQFFRAALRRRLIGENPFAEMKGIGVLANKDRAYNVSLDEANRVLAACPDAQWRLLFALSRFGGLRCPSEHLALRWGDVDWEQGRIVIRSPKTEHHEGKASRVIPLFPELRPYLQAVHDELLEDFDPKAERLSEQPVITRYRGQNSNLRTHLERIIAKAGLKPWPKLFQNLRATRETELAEKFPSHVVCEWIGHSATVAVKHYLQVTDSHFAAAAGKPVHIPMQTGAGRSSQEPTGEIVPRSISEKRDTSSLIVLQSVGDTGLEESNESPGNLQRDDSSYAPVYALEHDSAGIAPPPTSLADLWSTLSDAARDELSRLARAAQVEGRRS